MHSFHRGIFDIEFFSLESWHAAPARLRTLCWSLRQANNLGRLVVALVLARCGSHNSLYHFTLSPPSLPQPTLHPPSTTPTPLTAASLLQYIPRHLLFKFSRFYYTSCTGLLELCYTSRPLSLPCPFHSRTRCHRRPDLSLNLFVSQ